MTTVLTPNKLKSFNEVIEFYHQKVDETGYYNSRGLSNELISKYKLGYAANGFYEAITITKGVFQETLNDWQKHYKFLLPSFNEDGDCVYILPRLDESDAPKDQHKTHNLKGCPTYFFNQRYIEESTQHEVLFVVEGIFDALSFEEIGHKAISINSCTNVKKFYELLDKHQKNNNTTSFVFIPDNDSAGSKMVEQVKQTFQKSKNEWMFGFMPPEFKDVNELLINDRETFVRTAERLHLKAENLATDFVVGHIDSFEESLKEDTYTPIKTGFNNLDQTLNGGFYPGLIVIGAEPGVGKTALMNQISINVVKRNTPVLFASLEMSMNEMIMRTLSNQSYAMDKRLAFTDGDLKKGSYDPFLYESVLQESSSNIFSKFSVIEGDFNITIDKIEKRAMKFAKKVPQFMLVVDYLQIIQIVGVTNQSDKNKVEEVATRLKQLSKKLQIPVVAISSISRSSYNVPLTLASFKESGGIEFGADVCIGLSLNYGDAFYKAKTDSEKHLFRKQVQGKEVREIRLDILKNRNGKPNEVASLIHIAKHHYFTEKKAA
ncbi:DnaB-like helicase C-terminal domain-containing protein [Alkalibacillus haloalkaliphilus]|uniref:DnaB-like helicase C-terminal domain-containing protein n=1 Tax=Alkalibacillus haloalkaliphilus TaxID=94136 RepID=UPI002936992D|nr:DnaB-like helicase C-terminal domain-containing protein [Alkalibacillus haloalkaliphilus]MDV2581676.1 DnaB-like helicase C-terminal domain-containing protein [Alkalibacillus haloalkaliphilus]